jgi:adenosylcobinamide-GDP ribazoletransferase
VFEEWRRFLAAVQFFTQVPVPRWVGHSPELLNRASRYFPAVGLIVGFACAAVLWLAAQSLPLSLAVVLSTIAGVLLTGAFHEDGLADYADAAGGSATRERMLDIMKDSRIGTYGALALILAMAVKLLALFELAARDLTLAGATLIAAHGASRFCGVTVMFAQAYVRDDDTARAKPVAHALTRVDLAVAALWLLPAGAALWAASASWFALLAAAGGAVAVRIWLGRAFMRRLQGYTGDCLGAMQQVSEIAIYLGVLAVLRQ